MSSYAAGIKSVSYIPLLDGLLSSEKTTLNEQPLEKQTIFEKLLSILLHHWNHKPATEEEKENQSYSGGLREYYYVSSRDYRLGFGLTQYALQCLKPGLKFLYYAGEHLNWDKYRLW